MALIQRMKDGDMDKAVYEYRKFWVRFWISFVVSLIVSNAVLMFLLS